MARNTSSVVQPIQPPKDPSQDPCSPYYVHSSDGPSSISVTPVLSSNGSNYHSWARSMRRALGGKNKFDFVYGSIEVPDNFHPSFKAWSRCNMLVHSWIMNSVAESIGQSIVFVENAIDVWKELKERFSQGDLIRISELQCEIYGLKQGSLTVTEFFSELKVLWEELESYMPMPVCNCPRKCVCPTGISLAQSPHSLNRTIRFLTGLNENFAMVRSQILLMDPLPDLNIIFSMVIQHERQFCSSDETKVMATNADFGRPQGHGRGGYSSTNGNRNSSKVCSHCGRIGHTIETCYKKHGFPPNWQRSTTNFDGSLASEAAEQKDEEENRTAPAEFTQEQYDKLTSLIQGSSISQMHLLHPVKSVWLLSKVLFLLINQSQDLRTKKMNGLGEMFEGLYYLVEDVKVVNSSRAEEEEIQTLPESALWHFRLGHLSNSRMQIMHTEFPFVNVDPNSM